MGLIREIENSSIIAVDTTVFIYYIEKNEKYFDILNSIFKKCNSKENPLKLVTSMITLIEVLTKPLKEGRKDLVTQYQNILLSSSNVFVHIIDTHIAKISAELRAKYNLLRIPDTIQIATAIHTEADYFIGNDKRLKNISEIRNLLLDELLLKV